MKRFLSLLLLLTLISSLLIGCQSANESKEDTQTQMIIVGASATPHAEILYAIKPLLKEQGYSLQIIEFADYILPNQALSQGEIDANFFQHQPYLDSFNTENNADLVSVAGVHFEPLGIYPGKKSSLAELEAGDEIAVPSDTTNEARALLLLADNGLIKLNQNAGINATIKDITENPLNLKFRELDAAQIARALPDVAIGVINGNYAMLADLSVETDAIATEAVDSVAAKTYANILVVKKENENSEAIKALVKAINSDVVKTFIEENYKGSVVPIF